jgi:hypothetical protein
MTNIKELGRFQIRSKIADNWIETKDAFITDNLQIYYNENFNNWRLKDTTLPSSTDLTIIIIPLKNEEIRRIKQFI